MPRDEQHPATLSPSTTDRREQLQRHWDEVKRLLQQRAYEQALQELEQIRALDPEDPWLSAYHTLCKNRLGSQERLAELSPTEFGVLQETLRQEQQAQEQATKQAKVVERDLKREQARWDAELKRLEREAIREQKAKQVRERVEAVRRRQEAAKPQRQVARHPPPVTPSPKAPAAPPSAAQPPAPFVSSPSTERQLPPPPTFELAPVIVPTPEQPSAIGVSTFPRELPPPGPPGSVQIVADQLNVSSDQRIAVAEGNVRVVFDDGWLTCDHVTVFTDTNDVYARGRVHLERGLEVYRAELVHYNTRTKKGRFLEGTAYQAPWYEHGRFTEHIAEGVLRVKGGYLTSCDLEPPHFRFQGRSATVFSTQGIARGRNVNLFVEDFPLIYLPWLSIADRQTPFFLIPGKKKPWEQFALMGYRYEWPSGHQGALRWDWRRAFGWGFGIDHRFEDQDFGKGLIKVYYNEEPNLRVINPKASLPKGAALQRYRVLVRHQWRPMPDTTVVTDLQKFSDVNYRRDLLFQEEHVNEGDPDSFISMVTSDPNYSLSVVARKRLNRFQTVTEAFPDLTFTTRPQRLGETTLYPDTTVQFSNFQTKRAHSDDDTDVVRLDWFEQLRYAVNLFKPVFITPNVGIRQTYYTKDKQGGSERPVGKRDLISGQFSGGVDTSLKLFRILPITTNALGLNINLLRHVLTPTVSYSYVHQPTVPSDLLSFPISSGPTNKLTFGLENKLQTKRRKSPEPGQRPDKAKFQSADLARFIVSVPYTFQGHGNKRGGLVGDWAFDLELYPWPWMRLETDWSYPSHFVKGSRDSRITQWSLDLVMVGGRGEPQATEARHIQTPTPRTFQPGPQLQAGIPLLPQGQWYFGFRHSFSHNDKTEDLIQFDWRLSDKWQIGTFHRFTWKEAAGGVKRFNNIREAQYTLTRDLHDWLAELVYRVDREFGEELFFVMTLNAYPKLPIELGTSYHQPKIGSQSSPFSPVLKE